jgi:hypothetical protein
MNESTERRKILDMLAAGQISVEQATELLKALGPVGAVPPVPPVPPVAPKRRGIAKILRINIDAGDEGGDEKAKIRVNVPIALAKFASKFMPQEAKAQLDLQGIDLAELLETIGDDLPEGRLVDIDATEEGKGKAKIIIEVV